MRNPLPTTLDAWLTHCERLHPKNIEMGLDRVREVAHRMDLRFDVPVITVAGTNGKGSTCAMLEAILLQAGVQDDASARALMLQQPSVIKRPVVDWGPQTQPRFTVGFKAETWAQLSH